MKQQRQQAVLDIVGRHEVANQMDLLDLLQRRGFAVNQATVSRDIKELGLVKAGGHYSPPDASRRGSWDILNRVMRDHASLVDQSESLIVIKTPPGRAHLIASTIDDMGEHSIVGTIAGDDTLIVIPRTRADQSRLVKRLQEALV